MTARTLILLRHAKAETPGELLDVERRLTDRGRRDASAAGSWLALQGLLPGLVLCSSATRTRQTWHAVATALTREEAALGRDEMSLREDVALAEQAARESEGPPTNEEPAQTTRTAAAAPAAPEVRFVDGLYDAGRTEVIDLLRAVPDSVGTVLVVGHNPTMSDVSLLLSAGTGATIREGLATSGIAVHRVEGSWSATEPGSMPLVTTHTARG
ncbi:SixA phosphatase family protein [Actinoplanes sp. NPDC051859]|uniref:SixA phosphatase family protein n=1 Tax=Actinoplanes sp. NPDC051859 TaxID=3363909 RepID=UPI003795D792